MPVFENLKNFIRHGKQAHGDGLPDSSSPRSSSTHLPLGSGSRSASLTPESSHVSSVSAAASAAGPAGPMSYDNNESTRQHQPISQSQHQPTSQQPHYESDKYSSNPNSIGTTTPAQHNNNNQNRKDAYDVAVQQIVAEEKEQRSRLPRYAGLDRFKLMEKMGDGAFSIVYKALDTMTQTYVAVKIISKHDLSASQRANILKEVAIMRQLNHKNVVQLIDFKETHDHYFIVLELVPGGELFHQIVRLTYFSEDLSRHVIVQVAEAVRYLHEVAGVVHRDIKPENLLFYPSKFIPSRVKTVRTGEDESKEDEGEFVCGAGAGGIGVIKLADFGLSKIIWDSKTMTPCGTVGYTAPEIVKDERYSKSVDMWAIGCVLYTILCGFPPFYDESIEVLTKKVAKGEFTFLSPWWDEISDGAKDLVSKLLTVDPESRYTIDQLLQHPWITQRPAAAVPPGMPTGPIVNKNVRRVAATAGASLPNTPGAGARFAAQGSTSPMGVGPAGATTGVTNVTGTPIQVDKEFLSPVAVTLKEVFDVSNAVHRMEEENYRNSRRRAAFGVLEEEDDESSGSGSGSGSGPVVGSSKTPSASTKSRQPDSSRASRRHNHDAPSSKFFDLHLEGATLLERRKRAQGREPTPQLVI